MIESLFPTPPTISSPDNAEDTYSMAVRITFAIAGNIIGIRYWGASFALGTSARARVFTTGGTPESDDAFSTNLATAWNTVTLGTPVAVGAGQTRDIVVGPRNRYAANTGEFTSPLVVGNLTATAGRFIVDATSPPPFPTTSSTTSFGIDVLFETPDGQVISLTTLNETDALLSLNFKRTMQLSVLNETDALRPINITGGVALLDTHGWIPKINRHCAYLELKTFQGNAAYIKRRPAIITAVNGNGTLNLRIGHHGETYTNVPKRDASHLSASFVSF